MAMLTHRSSFWFQFRSSELAGLPLRSILRVGVGGGGGAGDNLHF